MQKLAQSGIPTSALVAPIIPAINDNEIEEILEAVAGAGARQAHYILLRLPHELVAAFKSTLQETVAADLLLHVVDAHSHQRAEQMREVEDVLHQIEAASIPFGIW